MAKLDDATATAKRRAQSEKQTMLLVRYGREYYVYPERLQADIVKDFGTDAVVVRVFPYQHLGFGFL